MYLRFFLFALLTSLGASAQGRITAEITNFDNNKGVLRACLFDNAAAFGGKGSPVQCVEVTITNKTARIVFDRVPAGTYAVSVFHDANNNKEFDTNFLGIPSEGYGASRNSLPFAAAPKFNDNKFTVSNGMVTELKIKLRNL
jgi:uncharacterized protein (DUF2141 family)